MSALTVVVSETFPALSVLVIFIIPSGCDVALLSEKFRFPLEFAVPDFFEPSGKVAVIFDFFSAEPDTVIEPLDVDDIFTEVGAFGAEVSVGVVGASLLPPPQAVSNEPITTTSVNCLLIFLEILLIFLKPMFSPFVQRV